MLKVLQETEMQDTEIILRKQQRRSERESKQPLQLQSQLSHEFEDSL